MTYLSVNINKIATIRNARGGNIPNVLDWAIKCEQMGAHGITVHPRPDERHIRYQDVYDLSKILTTEFNIEGYPSVDFMNLVKSVKPTQVTLVPDPPGAITSNAGWDTKNNLDLLTDIISDLHSSSIRTSIFIDPIPEMVDYAFKTGTNRIELYTESYAHDYLTDRERAILPFIQAAKRANELNIGINAGHDLSLLNLKYFTQNIPGLLEVSIGHALISDALEYGMKETIRRYLDLL